MDLSIPYLKYCRHSSIHGVNPGLLHGSISLADNMRTRQPLQVVSPLPKPQVRMPLSTNSYLIWSYLIHPRRMLIRPLSMEIQRLHVMSMIQTRWKNSYRWIQRFLWKFISECSWKVSTTSSGCRVVPLVVRTVECERSFSFMHDIASDTRSFSAMNDIASDTRSFSAMNDIASDTRSFSAMNDIASDTLSSLGIKWISALMFAKLVGPKDVIAFNQESYVRRSQLAG